jgi:hypothetical protein
MTLTLHLPPELEADILASANARGLSAEEYVMSLVEGATSTRPAPMTPAERAAAWEAWAADHPATPPLSDEAISRKAIYEGDSV